MGTTGVAMIHSPSTTSWASAPQMIVARPRWFLGHVGRPKHPLLTAWTSGGETWDRTRVPASACPRISEEFLTEELKELGAQRFAEEYSLEFIDADEAVFPSAIIDAAFTDAVAPLWQ